MTDIIALLIAAIHTYIFVLESLLWSRPQTAKIFGMSTERMQANKLLAFNQGFYNLFLALAIVAAVILKANDRVLEANVLMDYAVLSVLGAGVVLVAGAPKLFRPALIQILPAGIYFITKWVG